MFFFPNRLASSHLGHLPFPPTPTSRSSLGILGGVKGDAVKPIAEQFGPRNGVSFMQKHKEGGLEGILGVLPMMENALAHPKHQRPVAVDQSREGICVPAGDEALEQVPVRRFAIAVSLHHAAEMADEAVELSRCHGGSLLRSAYCSIIYCALAAIPIQYFLVANGAMTEQEETEAVLRSLR
jgi:hypothetical protein